VTQHPSEISSFAVDIERRIYKSKRGCAHTNTEFTRARRRDDLARIEAAYKAYRAERHLMRQAIKKAKAESSEELLASLDADPWRRAYKLVLDKLRTAMLSVVGTLALALLTEVVEILFPVRGRCIPPRHTGPIPWRKE
jgi:hypothetical protein